MRGLRGECGEAGGFQRHGFAASVRAADYQDALLAAEGQSHRNDCAIFTAELIFKDRVAGRSRRNSATAENSGMQAS